MWNVDATRHLWGLYVSKKLMEHTECACAFHLMHIILSFQEKFILNFYFLVGEVTGFAQTAGTTVCPMGGEQLEGKTEK